jgi:hypothetical protein
MCVDTCSANGVTGRTALAPTTRALRMGDAPVLEALVALCGQLAGLERRPTPTA